DAAAPRVQPEDLLPPRRGGEGDVHDAVEAPRALERRVEILRAIRRPDDDHAVGRGEAVHLDEELVQRAVVLVVRAVPPALTTEGVDLVDEYYAAAPASV